MTFVKSLNNQSDSLRLLKYPLYESWNEDSLNLQALQTHAMKYYHHVTAFSCYTSSVRSLRPNFKMQQILLGYLIEEGQGDENCRELWQSFCEGLGVARSNLFEDVQVKETKELVDGCFDIVRSGFAEGLGVLYAYEGQTPEVYKSKIKGMKKHYSINDECYLNFFTVHMGAGDRRSEEYAKLTANLSKEEQKKVMQCSKKGAKLLWGFLDDMMNINMYH